MEGVGTIRELQVTLRDAKEDLARIEAVLGRLAVTVAWCQSLAASLPNKQLSFDFGVHDLSEVELGLRL